MSVFTNKSRVLFHVCVSFKGINLHGVQVLDENVCECQVKCTHMSGFAFIQWVGTTVKQSFHHSAGKFC